MPRSALLKIVFICLVLPGAGLFAQPGYQYDLSKTSEECAKGSAYLAISGQDPKDTITMQWSTGLSGTDLIRELDAGDYHVAVKIRHWKDSVLVVTDTTIRFTIDKELCPVSVDKYFSPNDDNYHDLLNIGNVQYYPDFELYIYNRWGQRVHAQKKEYIPWNGKWGGIDLPDGTYYYVFFYSASDKDHLIKGDITILR